MNITKAIGILAQKYGDRLQNQVALKNFATARVGGNAAWFLVINSADELSDVIQICWDNAQIFFLLGAGSNVLFSDEGFNGLVIVNHAKTIEIRIDGTKPQIFAESGAGLGLVARKAALAGLSGLEWATTIPGTIGGAVYGNAGAHGSDMHHNLVLADILQQGKGKSIWNKEDFQFRYRSSILKRQEESGIVLSAILDCQLDDPEKIKEKMQIYTDHRKRTQPPGASMGSMFKNPPGDYAGRLIEAAGLKGFTIGGVKVSEIHANFFVNSDQATARDIFELILHVQQSVKESFNVDLELEVELIGFDQQASQNHSHQRKAMI